MPKWVCKAWKPSVMYPPKYAGSSEFTVDLHATLQHVEDVVLRHVIEHAQFGVGQRAHGERNLLRIMRCIKRSSSMARTPWSIR